MLSLYNMYIVVFISHSFKPKQNVSVIMLALPKFRSCMDGQWMISSSRLDSRTTVSTIVLHVYNYAWYLFVCVFIWLYRWMCQCVCMDVCIHACFIRCMHVCALNVLAMLYRRFSVLQVPFVGCSGDKLLIVALWC